MIELWDQDCWTEIFTCRLSILPQRYMQASPQNGCSSERATSVFNKAAATCHICCADLCLTNATGLYPVTSSYQVWALCFKNIRPSWVLVFTCRLLFRIHLNNFIGAINRVLVLYFLCGFSDKGEAGWTVWLTGLPLLTQIEKEELGPQTSFCKKSSTMSHI